MRSDAMGVDEYLAEVAEERQECLRTLRADCVELLTGFDEAIAYGMPTYARNGEPAVSFASQKQYISVYLPTDVVEAHRDQLAGLNVGKSCIRYRRPDQLDREVVRSMLRAAAATAG